MDSKFKGGYSRMTNCGVTEHPEYSKGFYDGQQSKHAEIDKRFSGYQLEVSQVGQSCVKWREIAEGKQAEIDALKSKIQTAINRACMLKNSSGERIYTELKEILK